MDQRYRIVAAAVLVAAGCNRQSAAPGAGRLLIEPSTATVTVPKDGSTRPQEIRFALTNVGGTELEITSIQTKCHCAVAQPVGKPRLKGGESTELILRVTPPAFGDSTRIVIVETDSPETGQVPIELRLVGDKLRPPYLLTEPMDLHLAGTEPGKPVETLLKICAVESLGESWITEVESESKSIQVEPLGQVDEKVASEGVLVRCYEFKLSTMTPDSTESIASGAVRIKTTTPSRRPMRDFYVFTRLRSVIRAVPAQLFVSDFPCERKILVLAEEAGDFEFRVGADLPSWLTVSEDTTNVPPRVKAFKVRVHKPDPGVTSGTIEFATSIPNCPVVKVPITISSSAGS